MLLRPVQRGRAQRSGLQAEFIDARGRSEPALEQLRRLRELIAQDAVALDCTQVLRRLDSIAERGTSAHAQLAIYRDHRQRGASRNGALKAVVDWLLRATVPAAADAEAAPTPPAPDSP